MTVYEGKRCWGWWCAWLSLVVREGCWDTGVWTSGGCGEDNAGWVRLGKVKKKRREKNLE